MARARFALLAVALIAAAGWRAEVEWRGWAGLTWIGYFHWAIPFGALLFSGWLYRFAGARRPLALAALASGLAAAAFVGELDALRVVYSRWPGGEARWIAGSTQALAVFWLYPTTLWIAGRRLGAPISGRGALAGLAAYAAAMPMAIVALDAVGHRGGADVLHAIKSGFVIPLLVGSLGLPFVLWRHGHDSPSS